MREIITDAWDLYDNGSILCITTNGTLKKDGSLVMGRGIAGEAKKRFPSLPKDLGERVKERGNEVFNMFYHRLISFPVKEYWWNMADITLIEKSAKQLRNLLTHFTNREGIVIKDKYNVVLPRPGCGYGNLDWEDVKKVLEPILGDCDNLTIVNNWLE